MFGYRVQHYEHIKKCYGHRKRSKCEVCSAKVFDMNVHKKVHDKNREQCEICDIKVNHLKGHLRTKHSNASDRKFKCGHCGYVAKLKSGLN